MNKPGSGTGPGTGTGGLVYSTDGGRMCPACRQPLAACICARGAPRPVGDGVLRVSRERAGRGGKTVTLVRGALMDDAELAAWSKGLKTACGAGGTAKDGTVVIQGDHADRLVAWLQQQGFTVKRAGG